jgi:hypothetical protein
MLEGERYFKYEYSRYELISINSAIPHMTPIDHRLNGLDWFSLILFIFPLKKSVKISLIHSICGLFGSYAEIAATNS